MKNLILVFTLILFSCENDTPKNKCFSFNNFQGEVDITADISNWKGTTGYSKGFTINERQILIIKTTHGYNGFDLECPENDCNSPLTINYPSLNCTCSGKKYNFALGGAPQDGNGCPLLNYNVRLIGTKFHVSL